MHDVFISYSSKNKTIADAVCNRLESANIKCWYAPRDIAPGEDWEDAIINAIKGARIFILIYTKDSNASKQVLNEVANASHANCVLLPFRVDDCDMSPKLSYYLTSVHWMDAMTPPLENSIYALTARISEVLGNTPPPTPPTPPTPSAPPPKKKSKNFRFYLFTFAAILVILYTIMDIGSYFNRKSDTDTEVPDFSMIDISDLGDYIYPYESLSMFSGNLNAYILKNKNNSDLYYVNTSTGYTMFRIPNGAEVLSDTVSLLMAEPYNTVYFLENYNAFRTFDRTRGIWLCEEPVSLPLNENEHIADTFYHIQYMGQESPDQRGIVLIVYDGSLGICTKAIRCYPDGSYISTDISEHSLRGSLSGIDSSELEDLSVFLTTSNQVVLLNLETFEIIDESAEVLVEKYLPFNTNSILFSPDGRYLQLTNRYNTSSELLVWDLLTGRSVFNCTFTQNFTSYFISDHEIIYYNQDDCTLHLHDLKNGQSSILLDSKYFEKEAAFQTCPLTVWYDQNTSHFVFFVAPEDDTFKIVFTDRDGNVIAQSNTIQSPFGGYYYMNVYFLDDYLFVVLNAFDPENAPSDGIYTHVYKTKYSKNSNGELIFDN